MSSVREESGSSNERASLLVNLPAFPGDLAAAQLLALFAHLTDVDLTIAVPDASAALLDEISRNVESHAKVVTYTPAVQSRSTWTLTAADYLNCYELLQAHPASSVLILGAEFQSLSAAAISKLYDEAVQTQCDLITARYDIPTRSGLVNAAVLYPASRALLGSSSRFPLALDLCLSPRMVERLAASAQRATSLGQPELLIWPVSEAVAAGFSVGQCDVGTRTFLQPSNVDLTTMMNEVVGSFFADLESKASVWQRVRVAPSLRVTYAATAEAAASGEEVDRMIEAFRLAYSNLLELWSLVLPPQSLVGLKRLSVAPGASFSMQDSLWARIVYDFLLAYRLRTINRNHLLGAFTPLYLAWVASHLLQIGSGTDPERHIQLVAAAFEADKPYLVSRWRWPDRFNP